jgi:hypothetical protein
MAGKDTKHPHWGFDNLWYVLQGSASTGHTTGPDGAVEWARLQEGSLLWLQTGRGAWHAEAIGADERTEGRGDLQLRSVLFWVNLARKDKHATRAPRCCSKTSSRCAPEGDAIGRPTRHDLGKIPSNERWPRADQLHLQTSVGHRRRDHRVQGASRRGGAVAGRGSS